MANYHVWDELNAGRDSAERIKADHPQYAAEHYARFDVDGNSDGVYSGSGQVICVADDEGNVWRYSVTVDYDPSWRGELIGGTAKS